MDRGLVTALVIGYGVVWVVCFVVGLLADEDANHWDWPSDGGPGARVTARIALRLAVLAAAVLAVVVGFLIGLAELAKLLGDHAH